MREHTRRAIDGAFGGLLDEELGRLFSPPADPPWLPTVAEETTADRQYWDRDWDDEPEPD